MSTKVKRFRLFRAYLLVALGPILMWISCPLHAEGTSASVRAVSPSNKDFWRVYAIKPDVCGCLFTGASSSSDGRALLMFRNFSGQIFSAHVGDTVGEWSVMAYEPRWARIFNPTVNIWAETNVSTVTLRRSDGAERVLTLGTTVEESGLTACLVSLKSGHWASVNNGDWVTLDGQHVQVQCVAPSNVQIQANGQLGVLDPVSDTERQALLVMWEAQRKQAEEDYARALLAWAEQKQQERERAATAALAAAQAQAAATAAVKTVLSPAHAAPGADLASPPDAWITCLPIGYGWPGYWGWSGRRNW